MQKNLPDSFGVTNRKNIGAGITMTISEDELLSWRKQMVQGSAEDVSPGEVERRWQAAVKYIESGVPATLCTLHKDGRPQQSLVWVGVEDHTLVMAHTAEFLKVKNMRRDPRVSLSFCSGSKSSALGVHEYLVIEGTAQITTGGAVDLLNELAPRFRDDDLDMGFLQTESGGFVTRITPTRIRGVGPWQEDSQE